MDLKTKLLNFKGQEIVVPCSTWPCGEALFKEKVGEDWSNKHTPGIIQKVKLRASRNGFSVRKVQFDVNFPVAGQLVVVDIDYILEYFEDMPLGDRMLIKQELQKEADRAVARKKSKLPNSNSSINRPEISNSPEPKEGDDISTLEKDAKETVQFGNNPPTLPAEVVQKERLQTARAPPTKSAAQIIAELRATSANIVVSDADRDAARRTCDIVPEIIVASKTASSISSPTINTFPTALDDCTSVSISQKSPAKLLFSRSPLRINSEPPLPAPPGKSDFGIERFNATVAVEENANTTVHHFLNQLEFGRTRIANQIHGEWYYGTVANMRILTAPSQKVRYWLVNYDDGDSEEFSDEELVLKIILHPFEQPSIHVNKRPAGGNSKNDIFDDLMKHLLKTFEKKENSKTYPQHECALGESCWEAMNKDGLLNYLKYGDGRPKSKPSLTTTYCTGCFDSNGNPVPICKLCYTFYHTRAGHLKINERTTALNRWPVVRLSKKALRNLKKSTHKA